MEIEKPRVTSGSLGPVWALPTACSGTLGKLQRDPHYLSWGEVSEPQAL